MSDGGSIDWRYVIAIGKFWLLGAFDLGLLIWLALRKIGRLDGDDDGFTVFRFALVLNAGLLMYWVAIPVTFSGSQIAVLLGVPLIAACGIAIGIGITPTLVHWVLNPLTGALDGSAEPQKKEPLYSMALARRNQNEPRKAIEAIGVQLQEFPYDFEGMMLQAEIEACDLRDMPAARDSLELLLKNGNFPKARKAYALTTLADWELEVAKNPDAARAALSQIVELFPDSEISRSAQQRLLRLPTKEDLADRELTHTHKLPSQRTSAEQAAAEAASGRNPDSEAALLTDRLTAHPDDDEARERLAAIYAERYKRVDMATDQMEQLISDPRQPRDETVRRLNLLAQFHLRFALDGDAARNCLRRIIDMFPGTPAANLAATEIQTMPDTATLRRKSEAVPMVEAEKDLGLKRPRPEWS